MTFPYPQKTRYYRDCVQLSYSKQEKWSYRRKRVTNIKTKRTILVLQHLQVCFAKTSQDQHLKLTPQIRFYFTKSFPTRYVVSKSLWQKLFLSPLGHPFFFLIPHFQNVGLNVPLSKQNGGWVDG